MNRYIFFISILFLFSQNGYTQIPFDLQTGDILFQTSRSRSDFVKAIRDVTSSIYDLEFSHVGVAYIEDSTVYVLEAIPTTGVTKTPLKSFFKQSAQIEGNPLVVVKRLNEDLQYTIPSGIEYIKSILGKRYDFIFDPNNDEYYCSEIIYLAFRDKDGEPIFSCKPMTFKEKSTGAISPIWAKHFEMYKTIIPEGVIGTNPGDMSKSDILIEVHSYFERSSDK